MSSPPFYALVIESLTDAKKNIRSFFLKADKSEMVNSESVSGSVFAEATPRQVRFRSTSYDETRQSNLLKHPLTQTISVCITKVGFVVKINILAIQESAENIAKAILENYAIEVTVDPKHGMVYPEIAEICACASCCNNDILQGFSFFTSRQ